MKIRPILHLACAALVAQAIAQAQAPASFESPLILKAHDFLPVDSLRGTSYRFREQVVTDGFMATFEIDSDFGTFTAVGVSQAHKRMVEIEAIRKLVETSKSDLFAEGLRRSVEQPIDAVKNIVTHPIKTVKQAPKTVGHFFGKIGSAVERTANKVADQANGKGSDDVGRDVGNTAKNVAGFDKARLDTAKQLGVDPYSDNARLQEEMDKVTWAFFAGGLPLRIGAAVVSAGVAVAATKMVGIPEDTYALTQSELALRDQQSLESMQVSSEDINEFMIHPSLSTTRRHCIVTALNAMPKVAGRGWMIRLANECASAEQADFLVSAIFILRDRHASGETPFASLKIIGRLPAAVTASGELMVPAPVDFVSWTEEVAGFVQRDDLGDTPKTLIHTGKLSDATVAGLTASRWKTLAIPYPTR